MKKWEVTEEVSMNCTAYTYYVTLTAKYMCLIASFVKIINVVMWVSPCAPSFLEVELQKADCTNIVISYTVMFMVSSSLDLQRGAALVYSVDVTFIALMCTGSYTLDPQCTVHHTVDRELILNSAPYETLILYQYWSLLILNIILALTAYSNHHSISIP